MLRQLLCVTVLSVAALLVGCPPEDFTNMLPATLEDVTRITDDDSLTANEKRAALAELGFSELTINSLLRTETLGNQFGGDLRTAYNKVVAGQLYDLTPDEIQIYANGASQADDDTSVSFSDTQAQAVATFFDDYAIGSSDELEAFFETAGNTVPDTVSEENLQALFVDFDPALLLPALP